MDLQRTILEFIPHIVGAVSLIAAIFAGFHALLYRRDARTAILWIALIWLVPLVGSILYLALGVNRIQRRAMKYRNVPRDRRSVIDPFGDDPHFLVKDREASRFVPLAHLVDQVVQNPLTAGNKVSLLVNGDEAYPAMTEAIDQAKHSVTLTSYIFNIDEAGRMFASSLARAVRRGVQVRVLVDGVGEKYGRPAIHRLLRLHDIPSASFLPPAVPWRFPYMNLRSHRKIAVIDGCIGFTGGMNISEGNLLNKYPPPKAPIQDVHAKLEGPVVAHLQQTFADDWEFATGEELTGDLWFPEIEPAGSVHARGVPDGPDTYLDILRITMQGALSLAKERVLIVTPYFIPDTPLITALNTAAMRGVKVDILIPERGNLTLVQWASTAQLWQVIERGCRVRMNPQPFEHSKLMVVDGLWTFIGSGNWDPRSLRLNFEFNVECYDSGLAARVEDLFRGKIGEARLLSLDDVDGRSLPVRLRDGIARLLSPYL